MDTHREESTSEIPREAGLATWGAGSPSRGTSCPVIVLAPLALKVLALRPSAPKPRALCPDVSAALGERGWRGWTRTSGEREGSTLWAGASSSRGPQLCPRVPPRPTTSETQLPLSKGLAWGRLDTNLPRSQAYPGNRAA